MCRCLAIGPRLINAFICPIFVPWHTGAFDLKDPLPSVNCVKAELLNLLDHHRTVIRRYPETFLCLVRLSCSFDDVHVRPTLLKDDESDMGLLHFVKSADPFKVKTGERMLAEGEIPLNDKTMNMTVPPSAEIIQIVEHTIMDELKEHASKKKKRMVVFDDLPTKRLRADAVVASELVPTTGGKSPATLKRLEMQSGPLFHPPQRNFSGPDDGGASPKVEPHAGVGGIVAASTQGVGASGNNAEASTSVPDADSPTDDFFDSQTVETATAENIYFPE
ncbi:hypothetical protein Tco_0999415 [Tanacetum coccineum]